MPKEELVTVRIYKQEQDKIYKKREYPTESFAKILRRLV